jgi:glycosyltransferase involved in cell wall biosynthesis
VKFLDKNILIISPQDWEHISVSKHHYALELAALGNIVYFLDPPSEKGKYKNVELEQINENLTVIHNSISFPYKFKFYAFIVFNFLMRFHAKKIRLQLPKIDVVWSFATTYTNLNSFNADLNIYHQVDNLQDQNYEKPVKSAHFVFGVTPDILERLNHLNKHLIGHGLSQIFTQTNRDSYQSGAKLNVCYCGNLNLKSLDKNLLLSLISNYKEIIFHFIGPYDLNDLDFDTGNYFSGLQNAENLILYGKKTPEEIASIYKGMDAFLICYDKTSTFEQSRNKVYNSHKILEYLSTGKVIISTNVGAFVNCDIIEMTQEDSNQNYLKLFKKVTGNIEMYNSEELINKRREFAFASTYKKKIGEIEHIISQ